MTLYFDKVRQVAAPVGRQTTSAFGRVRQNAAPEGGGEVCYLRLPRCRLFSSFSATDSAQVIVTIINHDFSTIAMMDVVKT